MSGSLVAQAIAFLLTPILTRIFSPSEYGMVASFSAIQIILSILATMYYHQAIMIDKEDSKSKATVFVSFYATALISMIDKLAKRNIIHANKASNLKSQVTKHIATL